MFPVYLRFRQMTLRLVERVNVEQLKMLIHVLTVLLLKCM